MRKYHVYGIGAALIDTEIEVDDKDLAEMKIDKGLMTLIDQQRYQELTDRLADHPAVATHASGGSAANSIIAVSHFGGRAFYSGRVANDEDGSFYLQGLAQADIDYPKVETLPPGNTGRCLVMITPDAERTMNTYLGASETLALEDLDLDAIGNSEYLYIEGYRVTSEESKNTAIAAMEAARKADTKTAFSLSDPGIVAHFRTGLAEILGDGVDLLFCNEAEAKGWVETDSLEAAIEGLKSLANNFAITLGGKGAIVYDGHQIHKIAPHPTTAVDTNGAGDMFAGAFIYGLTHGFSHAEAGDLACAAASAVVGQFGPRLPPEQHRGILSAFTRAG